VTAGTPASSTPSHALLAYFVTAYAWTWTFNLLKISAQRGILSVPLPFIALDMAAGLGPLVAAVAASSYEGGPAAGRALLGQLARWRAPLRWYVTAVLGPVMVAGGAFGMWMATGGSAPPAEALAQWTLLPVFFLYIFVFGGGVGEELGWRGYALPRLQARYGALVASVLIGLLWAGWHIPAWFIPGSGQDAISFPTFVVSTTAAAIVLTWVYNSTDGGLPLVIITHTVFNLCSTGPWFRALVALPPERRGLDPFLLLTSGVVIVAICVVVLSDPRTLTARQRRYDVTSGPTGKSDRYPAE
jgi:membrane protease YdiL (CAAX protease family)